MYFITSDKATEYLFDSHENVNIDYVKHLAACIDNGVFTDFDITYLFSQNICDDIIASQVVPTMDDEVSLLVTYQAEEYVFELNISTAVDIRLPEGRLPMAKLINSELRKKFNEHGEIIAFESTHND